MPTVADLDRKIEEKKAQIARYEERRKALIAREREQEKRWRAMAVTAIGEMFLSEAGCPWTAIDMEALQSWLGERSEDVQALSGEARSPIEAKRAFDQFRHARRQARTPVSEGEPTAPGVGPDSESVTW